MTYKPAGRAQVMKLETDIVSLLARVDAFLRDPKANLDLRNDLAMFACVRIAGYVEQSLLTLATHHCASQSSKTAGRFAGSYLQRMVNSSKEGLIEFARRFESGWGDELDAFFKTIDPAGTFNSLRRRRNDIAHGLSAGVGKDTLDHYMTLATELVAWFSDKLEPLTKPANVSS